MVLLISMKKLSLDPYTRFDLLFMLVNIISFVFIGSSDKCNFMSLSSWPSYYFFDICFLFFIFLCFLCIVPFFSLYFCFFFPDHPSQVLIYFLILCQLFSSFYRLCFLLFFFYFSFSRYLYRQDLGLIKTDFYLWCTFLWSIFGFSVHFHPLQFRRK